jgi:hypothetical protein
MMVASRPRHGFAMMSFREVFPRKTTKNYSKMIFRHL